MLLKMQNFLKLSALSSVFLLFVGSIANAQVGASAGMWGSGYWGGTQGCNYDWQQGTGAVDIADEVVEEYKAIQSLKAELQKAKLEKKRSETEMDFAGRKLERVFDAEVYEFLTDVHIGKLNLCSNYKTTAAVQNQATGITSCEYTDENGNKQVSSDASICGGKDDVPAKLGAKWLGASGYCTALSQAKAGDVSSKICSDNSLRPEDAPKYKSYSVTECSKSLTNYKKYKILSDKSQEKIEQLEDEIRERNYAIADARERAKIEKQYQQANTSESYCPECVAASRGYSYSKPKRDWGAIIGQVGIGLGLGFLGAKYDEAAMEYQAQLGYPPQQGYPTAVSMGLPFVLGGVYGAINGTSGQGGFGCASGMGGTGYPYGVQGGMNGPFGGAGGVYGPYGAGGVFGYPQGMYGSPWGGGMYSPGYGAGGMIAGPWGGFPGGGINAGFAVNGGLNGLGMPGMAMCIQAPCPYGSMGAMGAMGPYGAMGSMSPYGSMIGMGGMIGAMGAMGPYGSMGAMGAMGPYGSMGAMGAMGMGAAANSQAQMQYYQQMMQLQQQQMQQAMQYQQMQMQMQMQAYQRQMAQQQQAQQISQEIMSLQMRLQMIYSGAYSYTGGTTTPYATPNGMPPVYPNGNPSNLPPAPTGSAVPTGGQVTTPGNGR